MTEEKYGDSYGEKFRQYEDKIKELEAQIEKMKNCNNCEGYYTKQCLGCVDYCNWKLREIKEK